MTLHDKLKEIPGEFNTTETGRLVISDSTISSIIQAVTERLPGEMEYNLQNSFEKAILESMHKNGWNAYREEVRKVLAGE